MDHHNISSFNENVARLTSLFYFHSTKLAQCELHTYGHLLDHTNHILNTCATHIKHN